MYLIPPLYRKYFLVFLCLLGLFTSSAIFAEEHSHMTAEQVVNGHISNPSEEQATEAHTPSLFEFDWKILVSQTINFFILLLILRKFLFQPIQKIIEERQLQIGKIRISAEENLAVSEKLKKEYEDHLAKIEEESYQIKQEAIRQAHEKTKEILEEARIKAENIVEKGEMDLFLERQTAWAHIREEVVQLTLMAAEKVVERTIDDQMHRELIKKTIDKLEEELPDHPR
jgi:F-type H+-transporting ATPase subunit b